MIFNMSKLIIKIIILDACLYLILTCLYVIQEKMY